MTFYKGLGNEKTYDTIIPLKYYSCITALLKMYYSDINKFTLLTLIYTPVSISINMSK